MQFNLSGRRALAVIIIVIGFAVFRSVTQSEALESQGVDAVKSWLLAESMRAALPQMEQAMQHPKAHAKFLEETAGKLQAERIEVVSVTRHGLGNKSVVRVESFFDGASPSGGMDVRYFRMRYAMVTGWTVVRETSRLDYLMALF
jgi:hypothetical protein